MDQDIPPKIDFDNAQYRLQIPTGNLGSADDATSDPPGLAYGIGGDREPGLDRPLRNGLTSRRPQPSKEQVRQWAIEEPKLLAKAARGDWRAAQCLIERHLHSVQCTAWAAWRKVNPARMLQGNIDLVPDARRPNAIEIDDLIAAALERFWVSVTRFKSQSKNGLNAYIRKAIAGAVSDAMRDWQNKEGLSGRDTRLRRFLLNEEHRRWPLEVIQRNFPKYTLEEIAIELEVSVTESYTEISIIDGNGDEQSLDDPIAAARSTSSQWSRQSALGCRWPKEHAERNVYGYEVVGSARGGLAHGECGRRVQPWSRKRQRSYGSLWVDKVSERSRRQEIALLESMGRRQYANWLVERSNRTDTYYEVRDGQLVKPNSTPATFKSEVADRYRETPRNVNSLLRIIEAEKLAKRIPKPVVKKRLATVVERYEMRQSWCMSTTTVATTEGKLA